MFNFRLDAQYPFHMTFQATLLPQKNCGRSPKWAHLGIVGNRDLFMACIQPGGGFVSLAPDYLTSKAQRKAVPVFHALRKF
jgi:hypothetical protein